jgi:hypothetical protein
MSCCTCCTCLIASENLYFYMLLQLKVKVKEPLRQPEFVGEPAP